MVIKTTISSLLLRKTTTKQRKCLDVYADDDPTTVFAQLRKVWRVNGTKYYRLAGVDDMGPNNQTMKKVVPLFFGG